MFEKRPYTVIFERRKKEEKRERQREREREREERERERETEKKKRLAIDIFYLKHKRTEWKSYSFKLHFESVCL